jgi:hypothetical protein
VNQQPRPVHRPSSSPRPPLPEDLEHMRTLESSEGFASEYSPAVEPTEVFAELHGFVVDRMDHDRHVVLTSFDGPIAKLCTILLYGARDGDAHDGYGLPVRETHGVYLAAEAVPGQATLMWIEWPIMVQLSASNMTVDELVVIAEGLEITSGGGQP